MYAQLGAAPLPVTSPASQELALVPAKFDQYTNPTKYGVTLNAEGNAFLQAVAQGFVPKTVEGLGTFLALQALPTGAILQAGLWDWFAFKTRFISMIPASSLPMIATNIGRDFPLAVTALEAQYGITVQPIPQHPNVTGVVTSRLPGTVPPPPPPVQYTTGLQILITVDSPPSPGDGVNFATVAWRTIEQGSDRSWRANTPWVRWTNAVVHRINDPRIVILSVADVLYEAQNFQGVPGRVAPMWDLPTLNAAINGTGPGTPAPTLALAVVTPPAQVRPAIPSGSVPIPDRPTPLVSDPNSWIDVEVTGGGGGGSAPLLPPPIMTGGPPGGGTVTSGQPNVFQSGGGGGGGAVEQVDFSVGPERSSSVPSWALWGGLAVAGYAFLSRGKKIVR